MYFFRVLYGNQITDLPPGVFAGLNQLQLLLVSSTFFDINLSIHFCMCLYNSLRLKTSIPWLTFILV